MNRLALYWRKKNREGYIFKRLKISLNSSVVIILLFDQYIDQQSKVIALPLNKNWPKHL